MVGLFGVVVALGVVVQPGRRAGVRHRRPEVEAVRYGGRREVVAAGEATGRVRTAGGDGQVRRVLGRGLLGGAVGVDRGRRSGCRRSSRGSRPGRTACRSRPGSARSSCRRRPCPRSASMLFHWFVDRPLASPWPRGLSSKPWWSLRLQVAQVRAVRERQVERREGARVAEVALDVLGEDLVRQPGVLADLQVDVGDLVPGVAAALGGLVAGVPERLDAGEPDPGAGVVGAASGRSPAATRRSGREAAAGRRWTGTSRRAGRCSHRGSA